MRNTIILIFIWVISIPVIAQKNIEKNIAFNKQESINLDIKFADTIVIHTWDKPDVYAKASVNINDNQDNDVYLTTFNEDKQNIDIKATFDKDYLSGNKNNCIKTMIIWEIYLPEKTAIKVETIDGNIIIEGNTSDIYAKSISGFIDWGAKPDYHANLELKTISGRIYSDLDLVYTAKYSSFPIVLIQKINDGGYPVKLETISGDIFCRKSE